MTTSGQTAPGPPVDEPRPTIEFLHGFGAFMIAMLLIGIVMIAFGLRVDFTPIFWSGIALGISLVAATQFLPLRVGRALAHFFETIGLWLFAFAVYLWLLGPGLLAYLLSKKIIEYLPYTLQLVTLLIWLVALAAVATVMYSRSLRAKAQAWWEARAPAALQLTKPGQEIPAWGVIILYVNFVFIAMGGFAAFALILNDPASPRFLPGSRPGVDHGALADFFGWHLLDAIPVVKATETLQWEVPLTYTGPVASCLLLTFKVMVIVPVIRGIGRYLKDDDDKAAPKAKSD
ncbi:MAG TPA: hypothetical protein VJU81_25805 [Methylomirabilota bacterium]|nr:hypothetical protein [Methylomirabilota bacterium]